MKFGSVYDPFQDLALDPKKYYIFGSPSLSGGKLALPNNVGGLSGIRMWALGDLTAPSGQPRTEIRIQTSSPMPTGTHTPDPANQSFFQLIYGKVQIAAGPNQGKFTGNLCLEWLHEGGNIYARWAANYNELGTTITWNTLAGFPAAYSGAAHNWLRFTTDPGAPQIAVWESSPDGSDWRRTSGLGGSANVGVNLDAMTLRLMAQAYTTEPAASWQIEQLGLTPPGGLPIIEQPEIVAGSSQITVTVDVDPNDAPTQSWVEYSDTPGVFDRKSFPMNVSQDSPPTTMVTLIGPEKDYDAVTSRERNRLDYFVKWLGQGYPFATQQKIARGYIGEVGWPGDTSFTHPAGGVADERWNSVGQYLYYLYALNNLLVTYWSAGDAWSNYIILAWGRRSATSPTTLERGVPNAILEPGQVVMDNSGNALLAGVNLAGAEFATPEPMDNTSSFSNVHRGTYGLADDYFYPSRGSMVFAYNHGVRTIRLPIRWERLQPTLNGALETTELARLDTALGHALTEGLQVIIDLHNYAQYFLDASGTGQSKVIDKSSGALTTAHLIDFWTKLAGHYLGNSLLPAIKGFGLQNEPIRMGGIAPWSTTDEDFRGLQWESTAQQVVDALQAAGWDKDIYVSLYQFADISGSFQGLVHSDGPWILKTTGAEKILNDKVVYEAHHYFQLDSGYSQTYDHEVTKSISDDAGAPFTEGVSPDTTYYFRIVAQNIHGTAVLDVNLDDEDLIFTTLPPPPAPEVPTVVIGPDPLPGEPGIDIDEAPPPALVEVPHFAVPFTFDSATGDVAVNEQGSEEEIMACEFVIASCPLGSLSARPDFGIPWPLFQTEPLNLAGIEAALSRLEPRGRLTVQQVLDLVDPSTVHTEIDVEAQS